MFSRENSFSVLINFVLRCHTLTQISISVELAVAFLLLCLKQKMSNFRTDETNTLSIKVFDILNIVMVHY